MENVFYYTSVYVFDISLEVINSIKNKANLHVFIEVTAHSKNFNIIETKELPGGKYLLSPEETLTEESYKIFSEYFSGCASVHFVVHLHPSGISWQTVKACLSVNKKIRELKPSIIHFEIFSLRTLGLIPRLVGKKHIVFSIHDAVPHSGENHWKDRLSNFLFKNLPVRKTYLFYSSFTREEFLSHNGIHPDKCKKIGMPVYTFYPKLVKSEPGHKHILFFGRVSKYKGIPILLDAMPGIWNRFGNIKLVIAGSGSLPEVSDHPVLKNNRDKIDFINRHIQNDELVTLIRNAIIVVCPYTDASQSGVMMTAFGLRKPVVATDVGSFREFIQPGINGYLAERPDPESVSDAISKSLHNNHFIEMEKQLQQVSVDEVDHKNGMLLLNAYALQ